MDLRPIVKKEAARYSLATYSGYEVTLSTREADILSSALPFSGVRYAIRSLRRREMQPGSSASIKLSERASQRLFTHILSIDNALPQFAFDPNTSAGHHETVAEATRATDQTLAAMQETVKMVSKPVSQ